MNAIALLTSSDFGHAVGLDLDAPASFQPALTELAHRAQPDRFLLLNAGMVPGKERVLTAAGFEAAQAT